MNTDVKIPELEDSSEGAKLTRWIKKPGDGVKKGNETSAVETEKARVEMVAPAKGALSKHFVQEGQAVSVGHVTATIEDSETQPTTAVGGGTTKTAPDTQYDLIVIGSGPGGYVCAIRAAQLGLKVAVVEKRSTYGGTCLNVGCIPSKALLYASEMFDDAKRDFARLGISVDAPRVDIDKLMLHKSTTVDATVKGVAFLFRKNKIDGYRGSGSLLGNGRIQVIPETGEKQTIAAKNIVIATGSAPAKLRGIEIDEKRIITSDSAIALKTVPDKLVVVGAGAIGLELGSVWNRLGSQVTVVEYLDHILSGFDRELTAQFLRTMEKDGVTFKLSTAVTAIDSSTDELKVSTQPAVGGAEENIAANIVLVAVGRVPYTEDLGLETVGVELDERHRVKTGHDYRTTAPGIWAIGDVIAGPMLAHKASDEGVAVAETIAGLKGNVNYGAIPSVVYTRPEIASVGKTEDDLKHEGVEYTAGRFPFIANGRARAMLKTDGLVKILAEKNGGKVLGAHILGASAGELIAELTLLIQTGGTAEQLANTCHAHPTLSEAIREAALGTMGRRINI